MDARTTKLIKQYAGKYYVPKVKYELIPINELICDQKYQRELSNKQVELTAENFDPFQINPVKVSRREGKNYVINGQHTMEIVAKKSGSRETPVWCMIYDEMDYTTEANVFAEQMKYVRSLKPYDIFVAKIEAEDHASLMIKSIVETYHLKVSYEAKPGNICAVKALEDIYDRLGSDVLDRTLRVCVNTWDGDPRSVTSNMLKGLAILLAACDERIRDNIFVDKLGEESLKELIRLAKDRGSGPMGHAESMLMAYNKKNRSPVPIGLLHKFKFKKGMNRNNASGVMPEQINEYRKASETLEKARTPDRHLYDEANGLYNEILIDTEDHTKKRRGRVYSEEVV